MVSLSHGTRDAARAGSRWRRAGLLCLCWLAGLVTGLPAMAEDGYALWLRYVPLDAGRQAAYRAHATELVVDAGTPTGRAIRDELQRGLHGLLGRAPVPAARAGRAGAIVVGTPATSPQLAALLR